MVSFVHQHPTLKRYLQGCCGGQDTWLWEMTVRLVFWRSVHLHVNSLVSETSAVPRAKAWNTGLGIGSGAGQHVDVEREIHLYPNTVSSLAVLPQPQHSAFSFPTCKSNVRTVSVSESYAGQAKSI